MIRNNLIIEYTSTFTDCENASMIQNVESNLVLFSTKNKKLAAQKGEVPLGVWEDLILAAEDVMVVHSVDAIDTDFSETHELITYITDGYIYYYITPDDFKIKENQSPYRLYYAIDTEKMYMNIGDVWVFVGSPTHQQLYDIGVNTHTQLDEKIANTEFETREW